MQKPSPWLVTGGTGFIGRYVVRRLLATGMPVAVFCRSTAKARALFADQVTIVEGDLCEPEALARACRGVHTVIHVGGLYRFGPGYHRLLAEINQGGTENLLRAAWNHRVEKVVHVSSAGVLEARIGTITEEGFPGQVPHSQHYRYSKWLAERSALAWVKRGLPVVIASPTSPLGAGDDAPTPTGQIVLDFLRRRFPFVTRTRLNFVQAGELAAGIIATADRGRLGERYLLSHHNLWLGEFLEVLSGCTGIPAPRWTVPWGAVALAGVVGECLGATRLCRETAQAAHKRAGFDSQKAADELAWRPSVPIRTSASEAIDWFQQQWLTGKAYGDEWARSDTASS